jgi:transposase
MSTGETKAKKCPDCGGIMRWDDEWLCSNCGCTIDADEEDYDFILME